MAIKNPQFQINLRKNDNRFSKAYGKFYPKAVERQTISLRGLTNHMAEHNAIYGRDIIEGVLTKMAGCIIELLSQGNPVKIDGLGTFVPTVESEKNGITLDNLLAGKWNASLYVKAIHIRFLPEGSGEDDITSRVFKDKCSLATYGVEEKYVISGAGTTADPYVYGKRVTLLDDWLKEKQATNTGD